MNIDDMRSDEQYLSAAISTVIKSGKITLNTVQTLVEFTPEIMYPFASAMGVEVGKLKEMAHNEMLNEQAVSVLMDLISSKLMNKRLGNGGIMAH